MYTQKVFNEPAFDAKHKNKIEEEIKKIQKEIEEGALPQFSISLEENDLDDMVKKAEIIRKNFTKVVIIGVGGSNLGAKALSILSKNPDYIMFLDSIDPVTLEKQINSLDLMNTYFISISKSGETIETLSHTIIVINILQKNGIKDINSRFLFITENKENTLTNIAKQSHIEIVSHPSDIGGRYSYLSVVGLLPSLLLGLDIKKIRAGAKKYLEQIKVMSDVADNSDSDLVKACLAQVSLFDNNVNMSIFMYYTDILVGFVNWYRQLLAESIGKGGYGATPVNAVGTKDQHSQLQLYLHGPKDKFYTFLTMKNYERNYKLDTSFIKNFKYKKINGKYLSEILKIEEKSTIEVIKNQNLPVRVVEFESLNEQSLSMLMMQMFLEVIILCRVKNINPFDQPAVELRKKIARRDLL
ncbi:hypothetical protein ACFL0U_01675 [Pseudomonadota bacterium]